jgi:hypothetical protein
MAIDATEFRRVADELAIRDLVARSADAVVRFDEKAWIECWAKDARWILGGSAADGRDAVLGRWLMVMGTIDFVAQLPEYGMLDISGDRGTGRWYVTELLWFKAGNSARILGVYHDAYLRVEGAWRFTERRFDVLYTGPPDLSGQTFPYPEGLGGS